MNNNLHWAITSSDLRIKQPTGGYVYHEVCDIQVRHQPNERLAIKRAKEIIQRKHYFVRSVYECDCATTRLHNLKALEVSKDATKALKKLVRSDEDDE